MKLFPNLNNLPEPLSPGSEITEGAMSAAIDQTSQQFKMSEAEKRKRSKSKHRKNKKKDEKDPCEFDSIPDVAKVVISEETQQVLQCIAGVTISGEDPWMFINKENFDDAFETSEGCKDFDAIKKDIQDFQTAQILVYYSLDESTDTDEFYICLSKAAQSTVAQIMARMRQDHRERMAAILEKDPRPWRSLGSEEEVDDELMHRNRLLYQVELITKYPILNGKAQFRLRLVESLRDGYVELLPERYPMNAVYQKKVDVYVQASPLCVGREMQTDCTYPMNAWTQYQYEYKIDEEPTENFQENMKTFLDEQMEQVFDQIRVNGGINLYSNDYENLIKNQQFTKPPKVIAAREYMSFMEARICKDKMISSVAWHPFYTGVFAVSYCDSTMTRNLTEDEAYDKSNRLIYNSNPVLVWSFVDSLKPKLILEAHSEVNYLEFCPHDSNLIIGGCRNGQILLWDIRNKLQQVEDEELLKPSQQKYRKLMYSFIGWIRNIKNLTSVAPTVVSNLKASHKSAVSQVEWMSPFHEISEFGLVKEISEKCETFTLQFISCSMDGQILFWDLKSNHAISVDGIFSERVSKRLKRRPAALNPDVSLYKALNKAFKPLYTLDVIANVENPPPPISCFAMPHFSLDYEEMAPNPRRKFNIITRILYKPILKRQTRTIDQKFSLGTCDGQFISGVWNGYDDENFEEDQKKRSETAQVLNISKYHDGPLANISRWPIEPNILLSVGGKIFCIWKEDFSEKPVIWRRSRVRYTHGTWRADKATFKLTRSDGTIEVWDMMYKSNETLLAQSVSGKLLIGSYVQPINSKITGIADYNGSLRMFHSDRFTSTPESTEALKNWLFRQVDIQKEFISWQDGWNRKYAERMKKIWDAELERQKLREQQERLMKKRLKEEMEKRAKEEEREAAIRAKPPSGKLAEWSQGKWIDREKNRINRTILELKHLKPDLLREQQEPLKQAEKAESSKQEKKRAKVEESPEVFKKSVDMHFPYIHMTKPPPPRNPYEHSHTLEKKQQVLQEYASQTKDLQRFIEENPFEYDFNWHKLMRSGRDRKQTVHTAPSIHKERHKLRVVERIKEAERAAEAKKAAGKAVLRKGGRSSSRILKDAIASSSVLKKLGSKASKAALIESK